MAIFQLSVKPIRRSQGGNAKAAAAAYRTGTQIGPHDYTRRRGVADRALFLPPKAPAGTAPSFGKQPREPSGAKTAWLLVKCC